MASSSSSTGGGVITDELFALGEVNLPRQIVENHHQSYLFNVARGLESINDHFKKGKYLPMEYVFVTTEKPNNHNYIQLTRYPELPYWNRHYSHPLAEEMSNFSWVKPGALHVYRFYNNMIMHMANEETSKADTGYWLSHKTIAFTY